MVTDLTTQDDDEELFNLIKDPITGPMFFFREILGAHPSPHQIPIINAFLSSRRIAVKSGHSCGKDWLGARLALLFHITHFPSIAALTGPTDRQVKHVVWGELEDAYRNSKVPIGGQMLTSELRSSHSKHYMIGFTAKSPEAFQGLHAPHVLVTVTEAPGMSPTMWPGIQSLMTATGSARMLVIGNATYEPGSEFYAMFGTKANLYTRFTLNSEDSPHCGQAYIDEMKEEYGIDSPVYMARVLGKFPTNAVDNLIPLAWIERAQARWVEDPIPHGPVTSLGLDVARFGSDMTEIYEGHGDWFKEVYSVRGQNLMATSGVISDKIVNEGVEPTCVKLDDTGLGGGVTDRLHELKHKVHGINFGSKPIEEKKFKNARAEMFWILRGLFRDNAIRIDPRDTKLLRDLSVIKYKMTSPGQIQLEAKADTKKRLGYSPDRADALALAALPDGSASRLSRGSKAGWGLIEMARRAAEKRAREGVDEAVVVDRNKPINTRAMTEVPGATEALRQDGQANQTTWQSTRL